MKVNVNDILQQLNLATQAIATMQTVEETPITMEFGQIPDDAFLVKEGDATGNNVANLVAKTAFAYATNGYIKNVKVAYSPRASKIYVKASPNRQNASHNPLGGGVNGYAVDFTAFSHETMSFDAIPCLGMEYDKQGFYCKLCL